MLATLADDDDAGRRRRRWQTTTTLAAMVASALAEAEAAAALVRKGEDGEGESAWARVATFLAIKTDDVKPVVNCRRQLCHDVHVEEAGPKFGTEIEPIRFVQTAVQVSEIFGSFSDRPWQTRLRPAE